MTYNAIDELYFIINTQIQLLKEKVEKRHRLTDTDIKRLIDLTKGMKELESIHQAMGEAEDHEARNATVEELKEAVQYRQQESEKRALEKGPT